jgi:hypothetical protein
MKVLKNRQNLLVINTESLRVEKKCSIFNAQFSMFKLVVMGQVA